MAISGGRWRNYRARAWRPPVELLRRWQHLPVEKRLAIGRPTPHPAPTQLAARPWERLGSALPAAGRGNPAPPPDTLPPGRPVEFSSRRPVFIFSKEEFDVLIFTNSTPSRSPLTCISGASGFIPVRKSGRSSTGETPARGGADGPSQLT